MAERSHAKSTTVAAKSGASSTLRMFTAKGNLMKALSGVKLPKGARIAIVSEGAESAGAIKKTVKGRNLKMTEVIVQITRQKRATPKVVVDRTAFQPDARSRALLQGIRIAQEDLRNAGGAYALDEVRALMQGVSRQAIDKRVQEGSLLAVPGPSNRRSYPTLQFRGDGSVVPGLKAIREALQTTNAWTILNFLSNPDARLSNQKPIDILKTGKIDIVLEAAKRYGEQGA